MDPTELAERAKSRQSTRRFIRQRCSVRIRHKRGCRRHQPPNGWLWHPRRAVAESASRLRLILPAPSADEWHVRRLGPLDARDSASSRRDLGVHRYGDPGNPSGCSTVHLLYCFLTGSSTETTLCGSHYVPRASVPACPHGPAGGSIARKATSGPTRRYTSASFVLASVLLPTTRYEQDKASFFVRPAASPFRAVI